MPPFELRTIDFDKKEDLRNLLSLDKHTRIEGLCSESIFQTDLLAGSFSSYSSGWWFTRPKTGQKTAKKLLLDRHITPLDVKLIKKFAPHYSVELYYFDSNRIRFEMVKWQAEAIKDLKSYWLAHKTELDISRRSFAGAAEEQRQKDRLEKAIDFLAGKDLLRSSAVSRIFANFVITDYSSHDVDFFVEHQSQFVAFEVKQKYPGGGGIFGVNTGEVKLLDEMVALGIQPVHIILTKPVADEKISGVDFYTLNPYKDHCAWIAIQHSAAIFIGSNTAPAKTSIYGTKPVKYKEIPWQKFHLLKYVAKQPDDALLQFLDGKTSLLRSHPVVDVWQGSN